MSLSSRQIMDWRSIGSIEFIFITICLITLFFAATAHAAQVQLAWNASTGPNLGGHNLHYGQTSGNYTSTIDVGNKTSYTVSGLQDGKTYYFAVTAYDTSGNLESGYSNQVSATTPAVCTEYNQRLWW